MFKNTNCNSDQNIKKLSTKLTAIRYCVEQAFGICKGWFQLLNRALECAKEDITQTTYLIIAMFVLHNFLIDKGDDTAIEAVLDRGR